MKEIKLLSEIGEYIIKMTTEKSPVKVGFRNLVRLLKDKGVFIKEITTQYKAHIVYFKVNNYEFNVGIWSADGKIWVGSGTEYIDKVDIDCLNKFKYDTKLSDIELGNYYYFKKPLSNLTNDTKYMICKCVEKQGMPNDLHPYMDILNLETGNVTAGCVCHNNYINDIDPCCVNITNSKILNNNIRSLLNSISLSISYQTRNVERGLSDLVERHEEYLYDSRLNARLIKWHAESNDYLQLLINLIIYKLVFIHGYRYY